jgi:hypothetical protein
MVVAHLWSFTPAGTPVLVAFGQPLEIGGRDCPGFGGGLEVFFVELGLGAADAGADALASADGSAEAPKPLAPGVAPGGELLWDAAPVRTSAALVLIRI